LVGASCSPMHSAISPGKEDLSPFQCVFPRVAAQHGIAVDRFAREIVRILKVGGGALAATECQDVGALPSHLYQ